MQISLPVYHTVTVSQNGMRLDAVLGYLFPKTSLRARRRLWDWCAITVNNRPRQAGFHVTEGEYLVLQALQERATEPLSREVQGPCVEYKSEGWLEGSGIKPAVRLAFLDADYAAFIKPAEMHTVHLQGGVGQSVESYLADQWPSLLAGASASKEHKALWEEELPHLLTRLDYPTSGLVLAARHERAFTRFRDWEEQGILRKYYFTVVEGLLSEQLTVQAVLRVDNRKKTNVRYEDTPDPSRWTTATPLVWFTPESSVPQMWSAATRHALQQAIAARMAEQATLASSEYSMAESVGAKPATATLVEVTIARGARHQIRAHMATAGFPLVGDTLYGGQGSESFLLHHAALHSPAWTITAPPQWW